MSLSEAIKQAMNARDLSTAEVARRLAEGYDRATFYRLLGGATTEPRLGTLVGLCAALEISPTELLQLAGLWPQRDRAADAQDIRLRRAFARIQRLPRADKRRAVVVIAAVADGWDVEDRRDTQGAEDARPGECLARASQRPDGSAGLIMSGAVSSARAVLLTPPIRHEG